MPNHPRAAASPPPPWRWVWAYVVPDRRERLRLTFAGYTLCAVAVALAVAAYNNAGNILFLSLSLTLSMFGLNGALAWLNFWKLSWRVTPPARGRVGEAAVARIVVSNNRSAVPAYALRFSCRVDGVAAVSPVWFGDPIAAGRTRELPLAFTPTRRGRLMLVLDGATSSHPFALMHKSELKPARAELLVLPARVPYAFDGDSARRLHRDGDRQRKGPGAELLGLREYRAGDPPRIIHWKSSAKRGRLLVRETSEPGESGFTLWLDAADFAGSPGAWEKAVSFAASLAEDLYARGRLCAAGVAPGAVAPVRRTQELHVFLDALAAAPQSPAGVTATAVSPPPETLRFIPGPGDIAHVLLGNRIVGEA